MSTAPSALMPTLFLSHGSPMFALEPGEAGPALQKLGQDLRATGALKGVVMMSPHWIAREVGVMTQAQPQTWHDFGGFPRPLYSLQYPAPGDPALAARVLAMLQAAGAPAVADPQRPFDHGAWVPLMHMFAQADVPVVQIALPWGWGPEELYRLGQVLAPLRAEGIVLAGSGSMTHNLAEFFRGERDPEPYVVEFSRWIESALARGDHAALVDYRRQAPHAARAHPTEDHFLPLFFALGAAGAEARVQYATREVQYGILAMDSFTLNQEPSHA